MKTEVYSWRLSAARKAELEGKPVAKALPCRRSWIGSRPIGLPNGATGTPMTMLNRQFSEDE
jgi:hypothetical protein